MGEKNAFFEYKKENVYENFFPSSFSMFIELERL